MHDPQVLPIVQAGDPVLRVAARDLERDEIGTHALDELIVRMRDTMRAAPGVGLAAPQVGVPLRLAVIEDRPEYQGRLSADEVATRERRPIEFHVIINPRLTIVDPTPVLFYEGCLSIDGWMAEVARARAVRVDALDERGREVAIDARGWYARILQHEIDHLGGTLYVDRMATRTLTTHANYARFAR
jgi:peptide deformylase